MLQPHGDDDASAGSGFESGSRRRSLPWSWSDVSTTDPAVTRLDREFAARDTTILYAVVVVLVAMVWALVITVFVAGAGDATKTAVVTVFSFAMVVLAVAVTTRRLWIIKYHMVHPAIQMLSASGAAGSAVGQTMLGLMATSFIVAVFAFVAGGICLVASDASRGAGIGLCMATTALMILSGVFYRLHAGAFLAAVRDGAPAHRHA